VEKYDNARQATDDNMAHAHCVLCTKGYKHTPRICNTYCFSTTTMVARTGLNMFRPIQMPSLGSTIASYKRSI